MALLDKALMHSAIEKGLSVSQMWSPEIGHATRLQGGVDRLAAGETSLCHLTAERSGPVVSIAVTDEETYTLISHYSLVIGPLH